jgi:hypothetical protein
MPLIKSYYKVRALLQAECLSNGLMTIIDVVSKIIQNGAFIRAEVRGHFPTSIPGTLIVLLYIDRVNRMEIMNGNHKVGE